VSDRTRIIVASLTLSASALVGIALHEGWEPVARPPVPGDVPTGGFGSTRNEAGTAVRPGEKFTPQRGLVLLARDADDAAQAVRRCAPVPMFQHEFDAYVSLTYNIGTGAFCGSTLARKLNAGDYAGACAEILRWDKFQGQPLRGLTLRRQAENRQCLGAT
jgi:lysozyme